MGNHQIAHSKIAAAPCGNRVANLEDEIMRDWYSKYKFRRKSISFAARVAATSRCCTKDTKLTYVFMYNRNDSWVKEIQFV